MRDDRLGQLIGRVWAPQGDALVLIGERYRSADGRHSVIWHSDPDIQTGILWLEKLETPACG